jgi:hypothetical protein
MPRISERLKYLRRMKRCIDARTKYAMYRYLFDDESEGEDELDACLIQHYSHCKSRRYLFRERYKPQDHSYWRRYADSTTTTDTEFLEMFRMSRQRFIEFYTKIKDHPVFEERGTGRPQSDPILQLMIFLYYMGMSNAGAKFSTVGSKFHVGKGTARDSYKRVLKCIMYLAEEYIKWPSPDERLVISARFHALYGFPNCVGCIDGTYIGLTHRPTWCGSDFFTRKSSYSVQSLLVCDDNSKVLYHYTGWPGSTHDNRVWRYSKMYLNPPAYFSPTEYLLSDSALNPLPTIVPAFKALPNQSLTRNEEFFNGELACARIKIEHTNGLLKSRFPILTGANVVIRRKQDVLKVVKLVTAACVLHNFLLNEPWLTIEQLNEMLKNSPIDDDDPEMTREIHMNENADCRRQQVFDLVLDKNNMF